MGSLSVELLLRKLLRFVSILLAVMLVLLPFLTFIRGTDHDGRLFQRFVVAGLVSRRGSTRGREFDVEAEILIFSSNSRLP